MPSSPKRATRRRCASISSLVGSAMAVLSEWFAGRCLPGWLAAATLQVSTGEGGRQEGGRGGGGGGRRRGCGGAPGGGGAPGRGAPRPPRGEGRPPPPGLGGAVCAPPPR